MRAELVQMRHQALSAWFGFRKLAHASVYMQSLARMEQHVRSTYNATQARDHLVPSLAPQNPCLAFYPVICAAFEALLSLVHTYRQ